MGVTLQPSAPVIGTKVVFKGKPGDIGEDDTDVELRLSQIDIIATRWKLTARLPVERRASDWTVVLPTEQLNTGAVYEAHLFVAGASHDPASPHPVPTDQPLYFTVTSGPAAEALTHADVVELVTAVHADRRQFYDRAFGAVDAPIEYRAIVLVLGLHLTTRLAAPGLVVEPISLNRGPTWDGTVLSELLAVRGWRSVADLDAWSSTRLRQRPAALISFERVRAHGPEEAHELVVHWADAALSILALRRGALGEVAGVAIQARQGDDYVHIAPHGRTYSGNLLGGFLSGEDPHAFVADVHAVESDTRLRLLVRLYADAEHEANLDVAYFKFWSLLEVIASQRIPKDLVVTDFHGQPFPSTGGPVTTSGARSRVYELLKRHFLAGHISDSESRISLWDATEVWYGRRNATAHEGGFRPNDCSPQAQNWYPAVLAAYRSTEEAGGQDRFHDSQFGRLQRTAQIIVSRELRGLPLAYGEDSPDRYE